MKKILKQLYKALPFKRELFHLLRAVYTPSLKTYRHFHFVGDFKVEIDQKRSFKMRHYGFQIENDVFWTGLYKGWERVSLSIWVELCEHANIVFDIGANTGIYGLIAKGVNAQTDVYAFEPITRVYEKLAHNNTLNNFDISCVEKAMSNATGTATIYDQDSDHNYTVAVNKDLNEAHIKSIPVEIQTITLDQFIDDHNLPGIDLMKIDVETHEVEVLEGFARYIKKFRPSMLIEILNEEVARGIEEKLQGLDYLYYIIDEKSGVKKVDSLSKSDTHNFLVASAETVAKLTCLEAFEASYGV